MKNIDIILEAKEYLSSSFTDFKFEASDFLRDEKSIASHTQNTDFIYVGYYKPIESVYIAMNVVNSTSGTLVAEYYNGTAWTSLTVFDDTRNFTRDGFVQWQKPSNWAKNTVDSVEKFWIRFSVNSAADTEIMGIGSLFSDDNDLIAHYPDIQDSEFKLGQSKLLNNHIAARDWIIQELRNKGIFKIKASNDRLDDLDVWDVLNNEQLKMASIFYTLYNIFSNISDNAGDIYMINSNKFLKRAQSALNLAKFDIDSDDDGIADVEEENNVLDYRMYR